MGVADWCERCVYHVVADVGPVGLTLADDHVHGGAMHGLVDADGGQDGAPEKDGGAASAGQGLR